MKIIKISTISTIGTIIILIFLNNFNKITTPHRWFIMYGFDYYFHKNYIPIMIFSTISFSILMNLSDNS